MANPEISVVVPVKGDLDSLDILLESLRHQTLPMDRFEVVVVHNDLDALDLSHSNLNLVSLAEPRGYSYSARNTGIKAARGDYIAFTDADCVCHPAWLESALATLRRRPSTVLAGDIIVFSQRRRPTLVEKHQMVFAFDQKTNILLNRGVPTANLIISRSTLDIVGNFSEEMESGGDAEWSRRASAAGIEILFGSDAIVFHPARETFRELFSQRARHATALSALPSLGQRLQWFRRWTSPRQKIIARLRSNARITGGDKVKILGLQLALAVFQLVFGALKLLGFFSGSKPSRADTI